MNETLKPNRWRAFAVQMGVLAAIWLLVSTTFAAQFYWLGKDWPLRISWSGAFLHSFVEWAPWLVLSPLVMWLAERFRFDRANWLWRTLPHLLGCALATLAFQGISMLLLEFRGDFAFQSDSGHVRVFNGGSGALQFFASGTNPPSTLVAADRFEPGAHAGVGRLAVGAGAGFGIAQGPMTVSFPEDAIPPGAPAFGAVNVSPSTGVVFGGLAPPFLPPMPGPWVRFLQSAAARGQSAIPIYWAIVCVTWVVSNYRQLRERERRTLELEARLSQANLQTLKAQLQPHFLFNALNAISSLVRKKPEVAEDMIGSLSDFLRTSLSAAHEHEVTLRRELDFLNLYLEIQQARFGDRLQVQTEIDSESLDAAVPTLLLQPLVENSVRHGVEARQEGGTILIRALRLENKLRLEVRDNGTGFKAGQLTAIREGIGWSNTKARLQELYGPEHLFQITPNPDSGLTVTVELPWRPMEEAFKNPP